MQANYERGTKDSDVFETVALTKDIQAKLVALAGEKTGLHIRHKLYIDVVANGIPFLPRPALWHPQRSVNATLQVFELHVLDVLDVVDVVVSKLKRFSPNDKFDIDAMIERGLVTHEALVTRFRSAYEEFTFDARVADLPAIVDHLHQVERDMLDVDETEFDLDSLKY